MKIVVKEVEIKDGKKTFQRIFGEGTMTFIHKTLFDYCAPYVPMDSGMLSQTVDITPKYVHYKQPYAHFQYEGLVFVDERGSTYAKKDHSKHATSTPLKYSKDEHHLATSHWEKAMMVAKGDDFCKTIENYLKRK